MSSLPFLFLSLPPPSSSLPIPSSPPKDYRSSSHTSLPCPSPPLHQARDSGRALLSPPAGLGRTWPPNDLPGFSAKIKAFWPSEKQEFLLSQMVCTSYSSRQLQCYQLLCNYRNKMYSNTSTTNGVKRLQLTDV